MRSYFPEKMLSPALIFTQQNEDLLNSLLTALPQNKESIYGFTTHQVCKTCNTGWMSHLENKAKYILTFDSGTLKSKVDELMLTSESSKDLAIWITVKSLLLAIKNNAVPTLPSNIFSNLREGHISDDFLIEVTECETFNLNFAFGLGPYLLGRSILRLKKMDFKAANELARYYFVICVQVGHFIFRVSYLDKTTGLKREGSLKPTTILFPSNYNLPYYEIENEQDYLNRTDDIVMLFTLGLSLID